MVVEKNKLFVGNLDNRVKWFHLKEFFAQYGEVTYTKVVAVSYTHLDVYKRQIYNKEFVMIINFVFKNNSLLT